MLILAAFNCLSWWRISSKESLHSYQSQWSHLPGKLFILMCLFEVFIRMATPPPPHGFCFSSPQPIFMWLLTFSLTSHSGFLKSPLLIFLTYFFSPHTPPVSFCQGISTSVFLPFSLFLSWSHSLSRSINQHGNNNNINSNNHCYDLPYWVPIKVGPCPWKTQCEDVS